MMVNELLTLIGGVMLAVLGYFLKQTMQELKDVKTMAYETKGKLEVLSNDHTNKYDNLTTKMSELKEVITDLTKEIKQLNKRQ